MAQEQNPTQIIEVLTYGFNRAGVPTELRVTDEGAQRVYTLFVGKTVDGSEEPILLENSRELRIVLAGVDAGAVIRRLLTESNGALINALYGKDSGAVLRAFATETSGEQKIVNHGKDSAGNIDPIRTNDDQQVQIEVVNASSFPSGGGGTPIVVDPQFLPSSEGLLWDPGTGPTDIYDVEILVVNSGTTPETVTVGVDVDAGGSLQANEHVISADSIAPNADSGWRGPFRITGDDTFRGNTTTASTVAIHFRITKVA